MLPLKRALERRIAEGRAAPTPTPTALPLDEIKVFEEVFQHRGVTPKYSEYYASCLARSLQHQSEPFTAITVFWIGDAWACIDGHHRLAAYRAVKYAVPVPVQALTGSLDDAIEAAAAGNTRDKLPMIPAEKFKAAWRMCVATELSKPRIARAANVSERTVANMRRVMHQLSEKYKLHELAEWSWNRARMEAAGEPYTPQEGEAARDAEAERLVARLRRDYGQSLNVNPSILARALWLYNSRLPAQLAVQFVEQDFVEYADDGEMQGGEFSHWTHL